MVNMLQQPPPFSQDGPQKSEYLCKIYINRDGMNRITLEIQQYNFSCKFWIYIVQTSKAKAGLSLRGTIAYHVAGRGLS